MHYMTIVLELLQQYPTLSSRLRGKRMLMPTLERYARELKSSHETWTDLLSLVRPSSNESQIASEALEIALKDLTGCLQSELPPDDSEKLYVEAVLTLIRAQALHT